MPERERVGAPKGTNDIRPPESWAWQRVVRLAFDMFAGAGYEPIETPAFEHTEVFERGVGPASEVVTKQMYTFEDRGGRSLTLRPEGTAPVVRSVIEHGLQRGSLPVKLSYGSWMFRQERPQKGRYRQFFQVGIEAIGSDSPTLDAEVIQLAVRYLDACGVSFKVRLNSIGHPDPSCRDAYLKELTAFLTTNQERLAEADRERVETNPLRTFDSKERATVEVMRDAPLISDHLCDECRQHFDQVTRLLDSVDVKYELDGTLVRGLDYYTRTTFEFPAETLGSQDAVGGGGRYDGLSEDLGGPPLPGIGFALGIDRIVLAGDGNPAQDVPPLDVFVVAVGDAARALAFQLVTRLRRAGFSTDLDHAERAMKGQMKEASRSRAGWAAILGDEEVAANEVTLKDLESGDQRRVALDELENALR